MGDNSNRIFDHTGRPVPKEEPAIRRWTARPKTIAIAAGATLTFVAGIVVNFQKLSGVIKPQSDPTASAIAQLSTELPG